MQNLSTIDFCPDNAVPIHGRDPTEENPLTAMVNSIIDHALFKFLDESEADKVINGYRRSPWNEHALEHDIHRLDSTEHSVPKDEHYWNAINHLKKLLTPEVPLQAVAFPDLRHYKWTLSTNIGAPFASSEYYQRYVKAKYNHFSLGTPFEDKFHRDLFSEAHQGSQPLTITDARMTKHNLYNEAFHITRTNIHRIKYGHKDTPSGEDLRYWNTAFARQHLVEKDEPDKVRLVFGAPFTLLTAELMFIWPLQVFLLTMKGPKSFMLWGFETILGGWYRLRNFFASYAPYYELVATLDWSGFDKDARHTVIRDIHAHVLRPMFDFSAGYHPTHDYPSHTPRPNDISYDEKLTNLWNWMTDTVLTIPLLMPNGQLLRFNHSGIFSGYFQTQILDSLYNLVMIFTILSRMGFDLDKVIIKVQGDDSIFMLLCCFILIASSFLNLFSFYAKQYFGATLSEKKSEIRNSLEDAEVLRYRNKGGIPYRDEIQLLAQLRHPERSTRPEAVAARCVGIAYAACGQLPRTYKICEDIYRYLVDVKEVTPAQSELNRYFQYVDFQPETTPQLSAAQFPSFLQTVEHLMDPPAPLAEYHWPSKTFIGLPGRR